MDKGRVLQIGTPMEVYKNPTNDFVANFVGTSNCIEKEDYANFGLEKEEKPYIYKRPEEMVLLQNTNESGFIKVKIENKKFLGSIIEYTVSNNGKKYEVTEVDIEDYLKINKQILETISNPIISYDEYLTMMEEYHD